MKPIRLILCTGLLALLLSGCDRDAGYMDTGTVFGMDYRKCMCCGGWFIEIDQDTLRFDVMPEEYTLNFDSLGYPVEVYIDWHHKDPKCLGDEIVVERMKIKD